MADNYVSLDEACKLEGCDYDTLQKKVKRNFDDFQAVKTTNENGGRESVLIPVESLSKKARKLYKEQQLVEQTAAIGGEGEAPWYTEFDESQYKLKYGKHYAEAVTLLAYVEHCYNYVGRDKTEYVKNYAESKGLTVPTIYRHMKTYSQALAWAAKIGKESDKNCEGFTVLSLCYKPKAAIGRKSLTEEMKALIENILFDKDFAVNRCGKEKLYRRFREEAGKRGIENLPSDDTIGRYMDDIKDITENAHYMLSRGRK